MPDSDAPGLAMDISQSRSAHSSAGIGVGGRGVEGDLNPQNGTKQSMVKYGELIILGYNGQLPQGKCVFCIIDCLKKDSWKFSSSINCCVHYDYFV